MNPFRTPVTFEQRRARARCLNRLAIAVLAFTVAGLLAFAMVAHAA